jgi:hypothetical protein
MYGNMSEEEKRKLNELLSMTTIRSDGDNLDISTGGSPVISDLLGRQNPMPQNYIQNTRTGAMTNLDAAAVPQQPNVWADGAQVLSRQQMPDGRFQVTKKVPAMDGFGRQSSQVVQEIEAPDYLNPAVLAQLKFEKAKREAMGTPEKEPDAVRTKKWAIGMHGQMPEGPMKQAFGEKYGLATKDSDAMAKRRANMEGLGSTITEARSILEGTSEGQKSLPTASMSGSFVDFLGGIIGKAPSGATEAQQLKAIGGALVTKMPRMEGPQSDKDVQLYRETAGQVGDDTIPIQRRLAALKTVEKLWGKYEKPIVATSSASVGKRYRLKSPDLNPDLKSSYEEY